MDMEEDSSVTLLRTARATHRIGLLICATIVLVLSTHYFDTAARTREIFDRLEIYAQDFKTNNPCVYGVADVRAELESRSNLKYGSLSIDYLGPELPPAPTVDSFLDVKELYAPRCKKPDLVATLEFIEAELERSATAADGRYVKGSLALSYADHDDEFEIHVADLHRRTTKDGADPNLLATAPTKKTPRAEPSEPPEIIAKASLSYAEWLERKHGLDQVELEEIIQLVQRRSVRGVVEGLTFGEAAKVLDALADPEHDQITLFGFSAPATVVGFMGSPVLLGSVLVLLVYLLQIKDRLAHEPHVIRMFPWFVTLTGRLPAILTWLTLIAPVVTSVVIFYRLGIGAGEISLESKVTSVISAACTVAMLPAIWVIHESLVRIRPGRDPILESARHGQANATSLEKIGARLREHRQRSGTTLASLQDSFEISTRLIEDFERGQGDLPVSYLVAIAASIDVEVALVPVGALHEGSLSDEPVPEAGFSMTTTLPGKPFASPRLRETDSYRVDPRAGVGGKLEHDPDES